MPDCVSWCTEPEGMGTMRVQYEGQVEVIALRFSSLVSLLEQGQGGSLEACLNVVKTLNEEKLRKLSEQGHKVYQHTLQEKSILVLPPGFVLGIKSSRSNTDKVSISNIRGHFLPVTRDGVSDLECMMKFAKTKISESMVASMKEQLDSGN